MSNVEIGFAGVAAILGLLALRIQISIVLIAVSFAGIWAITDFGPAWGILRNAPFHFVANWSFSAVPMFLLMGYVASYSGLTTGIFAALRILLRRLPGALGCSAVLATAMLSAASGSSVATAAAMSRISIPEMLKANYDKGFATGTIAAAGGLGSLIPPSIIMIIYGLFAQTSIQKLFLAGIIPGILSALMFILYIIVRASLNPKLAPMDPHVPARGELVAALRDVWPLPTLVAAVLAGIFLGIFTPTEAGAIGALVAILIAKLRGAIDRTMVLRATRDALMSTSTIFMIAVGASMFASFVGMSGLSRTVTAAMLGVSTNPLVIILMISLLYLIMGMFIDSMGIMLLTLPVLLPVLTTAQIDLVWFGIILVKLLEIGLMTPPLGLNVYIINASLNGSIPLATIFRGSAGFILMDLLTLGLMIAFPLIVTWLPAVAT